MRRRQGQCYRGTKTAELIADPGRFQLGDRRGRRPARVACTHSQTMIRSTQLARRPSYRLRGLGDAGPIAVNPSGPASWSTTTWIIATLGVTVLGSFLIGSFARPHIEESAKKVRRHIRRREKSYGMLSIMVIAGASGWIGYQLGKNYGGVL